MRGKSIAKNIGMRKTEKKAAVRCETGNGHSGRNNLHSYLET